MAPRRRLPPDATQVIPEAAYSGDHLRQAEGEPAIPARRPFTENEQKRPVKRSSVNPGPLVGRAWLIFFFFYLEQIPTDTPRLHPRPLSFTGRGAYEGSVAAAPITECGPLPSRGSEGATRVLLIGGAGRLSELSRRMTSPGHGSTRAPPPRHRAGPKTRRDAVPLSLLLLQP